MILRHRNGLNAELRAALYYSEQGYDIYWPHTGQGSIDFIINKGVDTQRIQVKKAYITKRPTGTWYLQATIRKGCGSKPFEKYTKKDCDNVVVVSDDGLWIIPIEKLENYGQTINLEKGQEVRKSYKPTWDKYRVV